jgi:hypothetical protein
VVSERFWASSEQSSPFAHTGFICLITFWFYFLDFFSRFSLRAHLYQRERSTGGSIMIASFLRIGSFGTGVFSDVFLFCF